MSDDRKYRYQSIFAYASFQFCGHIDEYLIENTRRLSLFYCQPRFGKHYHIVRQYEEGILVHERKLKSSQGLFAYYLLWLWNHNRELIRFLRSSKCTTIVFCGHPVCFFAKSLIMLLYRVRYAYWIGDYFPVNKFVIRTYERLKKIYHDRMDFAYYLSDSIHRKMNRERICGHSSRRTVMWGVKPYSSLCSEMKQQSKRLMFVGLLRAGQGIENVIDFLVSNKDYSLSIVGVAANGYEKTIYDLISRNGLSSRVYFENRFHADKEVASIARTCFCGLALYDLSEDNFTHYADPGKVKAYIELGLPVIMTRISDIVPYVERFSAGEVLGSLKELPNAISRVAAFPEVYTTGAINFGKYFDYRTYYPESFKELESVWR